jgi:hypothetical protein
MKRGAKCVIIVGICLLGFVVLSLTVYGFLAVPTSVVAADVLVVEGWVPEYALRAAAAEFKRGGYAYLLTSGMQTQEGVDSPEERSPAAGAASRLEAFGIERGLIIPCPTPPSSWNRTSGSARAVREMLAERGIEPTGVNVVTLGVHARQTYLAYRRMMRTVAPVGIITVPREGIDPARWWSSGRGVKMVAKCLFGWLRELIFGLRS